MGRYDRSSGNCGRGVSGRQLCWFRDRGVVCAARQGGVRTGRIWDHPEWGGPGVRKFGTPRRSGRVPYRWASPLMSRRPMQWDRRRKGDPCDKGKTVDSCELQLQLPVKKWKSSLEKGNHDSPQELGGSSRIQEGPKGQSQEGVKGKGCRWPGGEEAARRGRLCLPPFGRRSRWRRRQHIVGWPKGSSAAAASEDPRTHLWEWGCDGPPGRRGFGWWTRAKRLTTCSSREPLGGWDGPESWPLDTTGPRPIGGYKRRRGEEIEEEFEQRRRFCSAAGTGRAVKPAASGSGSKREEGELCREKLPEIGRVVRRQEEEEKEKGKTQNGKAGLRCQTRPRWRGFRFKQFKFVLKPKQASKEKRGQQRGFRFVVRGPLEAQSSSRAWERHGDAHQARAAADGPGGFVGVDGGCRGLDLRGSDLNVLCVDDSSLSLQQQSPGPRTVCAGPSDRSASCWQTPRNSRCAGEQVHSGPYRTGGWKLASGKSVGDVPLGTHHQRNNFDYAAGPEAQAVAAAKPRLYRWSVVRLPYRPRQGRGRLERERKERRCPQGPRKRKGQGAEQKRSALPKGGGEPVERVAGRTREEMSMRQEVSLQNSMDDGLGKGLAPAVPLAPHLERGLQLLKDVASRGNSFNAAGRSLLWMFLNFPRLDAEREVLPALRQVVLGRAVQLKAMHRGWSTKTRPLFPLPLGEVAYLRLAVERAGLDEFCGRSSSGKELEDVWVALAILALNCAAGFGRAAPGRKPTKVQEKALRCLRQSIQRVLAADFELERTPAEAEKELESRYLSYTGEEIPKMQVLGVEQAVSALPPKSHGGAIDARSLVGDGTKWFLDHPELSLTGPHDRSVKLQAKVHVAPGEASALFKLLVERNICSWVRDSDVLVVNGQQVLNGMFGVGKGTYLSSGKEVLRIIMNLIPTNNVFIHSQGGTHDLPAITQYLSLQLHGDEQLSLYQSDMTSAFYLFRLPSVWERMMAFNVVFMGEDIGLEKGVRYRPGCSVIPMGWASAVSIMQELAERLTVIARLPAEHRVRRTSPLPPWLTSACETADATGQSWYHVYLDNYCGMQKVGAGKPSTHAEACHEALEAAWTATGVLSSAKKKVSGGASVQELGAHVSGVAGTLGPSKERLMKLLQSTFVVIAKPRLRKKWIQVLAGRWVHCMSFRRPCMTFFDVTWQYISGKATGVLTEAKVRSELLNCCSACWLFHTCLRAGISDVTTASDASSTGGAVGCSRSLTPAGSQFASADLTGQSAGKRIPVLLVSLFNGIGCAFRCYDLCGVMPEVCISYEISAPANRVTSRRWPHVQIKGDIKSLTAEEMKTWRYLYPQVEELHFWGGFPCSDLSSAKYGRDNLEGAQSSLFWEFIRVIKTARSVFGFSFKVKYVAENVASMDESAEGEITSALGVKPWRLDSADAVPIHRPRLCWTNAQLEAMEGAWYQEKARWVEISLWHDYPHLDQWLEPGAEWPGYYDGAILPTCMKSIRRHRPPPRPAGLQRVSNDGKLRWQADEYRFPPYQYDDRFVIWVNQRWRLISAVERELLHGLGYNHTCLCWNAGDIKRDPKGFEDMRKTLIGDSFNCYSFSFVAAMMVKNWVCVPSYDALWGRMGLAPGFCPPLTVRCPLQRQLSYGSETKTMTIAALHGSLLRRVNHTGSDVRISSGAILNPKNYPRQSSCTDWWNWEKVFAYKWGKADHINNLEVRAIIHSIEWRIRHLKECQVRIFHLTDSYVAMSVISKGRSSSRMLKPLLARLAVALLAWDLQLIVTHVESSENPTDNDSRS